MTVYYVAPGSGSNTSPYDTWAKAATDLQTAIDIATTAGDIIYCKGTQTLSSARIDIDAASGSYNGGFIKIIGVKSSCTNEPPEASDYGEDDYFIIDGGAGAYSGLYINAVHFIWLENIKVTNCGNSTSYHGFDTAATATYQLVLNHCWFHANAGKGYNNLYSRGLYVRCKATDNGSDGFYANGDQSLFLACTFINNGRYGIYIYNNSTLIGCLSHANTDAGIYLRSGGIVYNCVTDGNDSSDGIEEELAMTTSTGQTHIVGSRITNHASGTGVLISGNTRAQLIHSYLQNNSTVITAGQYDILPINGSISHVTTSGTDLDEADEVTPLYGGYKDVANDDFNLRDTATQRSEALILP